MGVIEEATYVHHHKLKMALIFSAMRHFAIVLREKASRSGVGVLMTPTIKVRLQGDCAARVSVVSKRVLASSFVLL